MGSKTTITTAGRATAGVFSLTAVGLVPVALFLLAGCNRTHSEDVVATVNGHAIMRADLEKAYQVQLGEAQGQPSQEQAASLRLNIVKSLIDEEIMEQAAAKMNLTATPEEVDAKLAEMKAPYTEEQFAEKLKANHTTLDDLRHDLRRSLTVDKLTNKEIKSKVTISDADVTSYFNQHKSEFDFIEPMYHLDEIRVTDVPNQQPGNLQGNKATSDAEARRKIQALKNHLESGDDFNQLAANFSENPEAAPNGGDLGYVPESSLRSNATIYDAISKLKAGQITDILPLLDGETKKPVGYVIYKLLSRESAGQRDISDPRVEQTIRQQLRDGRSQLLQNAYFETLRDQAKVENFFAEKIYRDDAR